MEAWRASAAPSEIAARYRVLARLGRGGSAYVYHVQELGSGREFALKRLRHDLNPARLPELTKHLEREFYALSQLRHPRVIEVYDYGVSEGLPHYTMELLDGGDLRASAPLPWRRACELIYDVASSLALLHSRRFVHRDVTPGNVRCTRDGRPKLIDFGAMVPMGQSPNVIGTPGYVAPEVQQRGVLDASTDLFSLGATLYFTLTGRPPFAAADLSAMPAAWAAPLLPPSHYVPEIPATLDALVACLLSLERALRPRSAFEVMQRLAAVAGLQGSESMHVPQGYLSAPHVVGRDAVLRRLRAHLQHALGGSGSAVWIEGELGVGRTRVLELCALEAMTSGACVLRLDAIAGGAAFAGAERLAHMLLAALPSAARDALAAAPAVNDLLSTGAKVQPDAQRSALQEELTSWVQRTCGTQALVIAIDDVQRLDEPTLAWLAALAHAAPRAPLLLMVTADLDSERSEHAALSVLARQSTRVPLAALTRGESDALFASLFSAAPNAALVSERIFTLAQGNPQRSLALAQYLLDQGTISYAAGAFSLPDDLPLAALPARSEALFEARIARLGALARRLAETQALSLTAAMRREDYRALAPEADARSLDDALTELIAHEIVRADAEHYVLARREHAAALQAQLEPSALRRHHDALAGVAEQAQKHAGLVAYHRLHAGQPERALDLLARASLLLFDVTDLDYERLREMLWHALSMSESLDRPKRERLELMRSLSSLSLAGDGRDYARLAPQYGAQLELDSGLRAYRAHAEIAEPAERLRVALTEASAHYAAGPSHARGYPVEQALQLLAMHVATSIAIGVRTLDVELLQALPPLLEPFQALSPLLAALSESVEASCDNTFRARPDRAHVRWQRVLQRLEGTEGDPRVAAICAAVTYGLGETAAAMGLAGEAMRWVERLDRDPLQRVNAMRVRRVVCIQLGDWAGAERAREEAELMALQANGRQLFAAPLRTEIYAHWLARDLAGVMHTADRMARLAEQHPGWSVHHRLAQGYFEALRGDALAALEAFDDCVTRSQPSPEDPNRCLDVWARASAAAVSTLLDLGRVQDARLRAEGVVAQSRALEIHALAQPIQCALAQAEAKSGDAARAIARVEGVIAEQTQRGVSGLLLGASYEARARIAISGRNEADAVRYAALAAREYQHVGATATSLTTHYGHLLRDARSVSAEPGPATQQDSPEAALIAAVLGDARGLERATRALELLCQRARTQLGYLFMPGRTQLELKLAAAKPGSPPSAAIERFASGFWQQQLEDAEMSAVLTEVTPASYEPFTWTDPNGQRYEVLPLSDPQAQPTQAGLAVLGAAERTRSSSEWSAAWLAALARKLSRPS